MVFLETCCGVGTLRTGCIIIGSLDLAAAVLSIFAMAIESSVQGDDETKKLLYDDYGDCKHQK